MTFFTADYEIHVTCDIAEAMRLFIDSTFDLSILQRPSVADMIYDIAEYWYHRADKSESEIYHINSVCPPDEYHAPVNDSVYTNYCAKIALQLPRDLCQISENQIKFCDRKRDEVGEFYESGGKLVMLEGEWKGKRYHPEFNGYVPDDSDRLVWI